MLFYALRAEDFFGRQMELSHLHSLVEDAKKGVSHRVLLCGPPGIGKSRLLRQFAYSLFHKQDGAAPFLYTATPAVLSPLNFARDYLTSFLCQRLGFETGDAATASMSGLPLDAVESIAGSVRAAWALDALERFRGCMDSPIDSMRCALNAPNLSVMHAGRPVAVMLDGFENLCRLRLGETAAPELVEVFEDAFGGPMALYIITGNDSELIELSMMRGLSRMQLAGLEVHASEEMFRSILEKRGMGYSSPPVSFLNHIEGRPYALLKCATSLRAAEAIGEKDIWAAYVREATEGGIAGYWSARFKRHFPRLFQRRTAIEIAYHIQHSEGPIELAGIPRTISVSRERVEPIVEGLYRAGFVRAEFGLVSAPDDPVLHDVVEGMYHREVLGRDVDDVERHLLRKFQQSSPPVGTYELALPATKEAELVAVKCIEQIGQNHGLDGETIGRLQMALVEACINVEEQKRGLEGKIFVKTDVLEDRIELSVEGAAIQFVLRESASCEVNTPERSQSIRLMKQFVDDVRIEDTARGGRIVLVKSYKHDN